MENTFHVTVLLGGVAIFLHGLQLARDGLQVLAGDRLRQMIATVAGHKFAGVGLGALVAVILQSSTAVIIMLVGFAGSGIMPLTQAMAVLLGADIGTTVTVQLLSFRLTSWALFVVFAGFSFRFVSSKRRMRSLGNTILGLGLLFYGLKLLADGTQPLVGAPGFAASLGLLSDNPMLCVLLAAGLTAALQGSLAMIAMLISFAHTGAIGLDVAVPMVLGANLGTTLTPVLSAVGQPPDAKRVAVAHILFKLAGVALVLPLLHTFTALVGRTSGDVGRQIANAHTMFNVGVTLVFLPFIGLAARAIVRFYRPTEAEGRFKPKYLDPRAIDTPPLAFGNATREFLRMSDIVGDMLKDCIKVFERNDLDLLAEIESRDDKVDILNREIRFYLARLSQESMTPEQAERQTQLITLTSDMENIGDIVDKNLLALARKKATSGKSFSPEGFTELSGFHAKVCENFDLALAAFSTGDEELARRVLRNHTLLQELEGSLRQTHIARLHKGLPEAVETTSIHFDMLSHLWQINTLCTRLADIVVGTVARRAGESSD